MTWKDYLNAAVSAGITGGIAAITDKLLDPNNFDFKRVSYAFGVGAVIGIVNHFRPAPGTVSIPKNPSDSNLVVINQPIKDK